jgi:GNAT superfamily N-acetyltransferase
MDLTTLPDGRAVHIRPLRPGDADRLARAYDRLSPESKYQRFLALKPHLSGAELRYLTDVDGIDRFALAATGPDGEIVAVGRYARLAEDPSSAEFAVGVGDCHQRQGIGKLLIERLADEAARHGVVRATASMLATNIAAHRLMHRLTRRMAGTEHTRHLGTTDEIVVQLAA